MTRDNTKGFALVTGTSKGIGYQLAKAFLAEGYKVWGISRNTPDFTKDEANYSHYSLDLTDGNSVEQFIHQQLCPALEKSPSTIALVNNASTLGEVKPIHKMTSIKSFDNQLAIQLSTPLRFMQGFLKNKSNSHVRIINISSGAASSAYSGWLGYCVPKAGLRMLGEVAAKDLQGHPMATRTRIITYDPGPTDTPMQDDVRAAHKEDFPNIEKFCKLKQDGLLADPGTVAQDILATAMAGGPLYLEKRFGRDANKQFS